MQVDAPVGITTSPRGELVVGQMGEINVANDSLITFYDPKTKEMLLNLKTELHDITATALAYSPSPRGSSMHSTSPGGYDPRRALPNPQDAEKGVRTKKIVSLDKPSAMAFASDGSLYITQIGPSRKKGACSESIQDFRRKA